MTEHEILVKARALIAAPERWTQGAFARDAHGMPVLYTDRNARKWHASSAVALNSRGHFTQAANALRQAMRSGIIYFNDTHTHAEVLAAFDAAIAATGGA